MLFCEPAVFGTSQYVGAAPDVFAKFKFFIARLEPHHALLGTSWGMTEVHQAIQPDSRNEHVARSNCEVQPAVSLKRLR